VLSGCDAAVKCRPELHVYNCICFVLWIVCLHLKTEIRICARGGASFVWQLLAIFPIQTMLSGEITFFLLVLKIILISNSWIIQYK